MCVYKRRASMGCKFWFGSRGTGSAKASTSIACASSGVGLVDTPLLQRLPTCHMPHAVWWAKVTPRSVHKTCSSARSRAPRNSLGTDANPDIRTRLCNQMRSSTKEPRNPKLKFNTETQFRNSEPQVCKSASETCSRFRNSGPQSGLQS